VATVVAAFAADPAWGFILGDHYDRVAPLFAGALFDQRVEQGTVWVASDASSVAMWDRPGGPDPKVRDRAWAAFHGSAGADVEARLASYDAALEAVGPKQPFWYLGVLASRPEAAGQGGATRVLGPGLACADADGLPAVLETSTPANRAFYGRRGFTEAVDVQVPGGPPTWWLIRPAR
jgi:hypothetical protein